MENERIVIDYDSLDEVILILSDASNCLKKASSYAKNYVQINESDMENLRGDVNDFYNNVYGNENKINELLNQSMIDDLSETDEREFSLTDDLSLIDNSDYHQTGDPQIFLANCQLIIDGLDAEILAKEAAYKEIFGDNSTSVLNFRLTYEDSLEMYETAIDNIIIALERMLPIEYINKYLKDTYGNGPITYENLADFYRKGFFEGDTESAAKLEEIMRGGFEKLSDDYKRYSQSDIDYLMENEIMVKFESLVLNQNEINEVLQPAVDAAREIATLKDAKRQMEIYSYSYILELEEVKNYSQEDLGAGLSDEKMHYLTLEEVLIYTYLMNNSRESDAEYFLDLMDDTMNQRKGMEGAMKFAQNITKKDGDWLYDYLASSTEGTWNGLVNFGNGFVNLFSPDGKVSASEYEQQYIMMLLSQNYDMNSISEQYDVDSDEYKIFQKMSEISYNDFLSFGYQTGMSVGNMLPSIAVSWIPYVGKPLAFGSMFLSSAGNSVEASYQRGTTGFKAYLYGSLMGISEVGMEYLLGGIPGLSKASGFTLKAILGEGFEEAIQVFVEKGANYAFFGEEINWSELPEEELKAFGMGVFMSFCMNGGATTINLGVKGTKVLTSSEIENFMITDIDGNVTFDAKAFGNYLGGVKALSDGNGNKALKYFENSNMLGSLSNGELEFLISNLDPEVLKSFNTKYQNNDGTYSFNDNQNITLGPTASISLGDNSLKSVVDLLNDYGIKHNIGSNYGIKILQKYLLTGESTVITRDYNLRYIVEGMNKQDLANYIDRYMANYNSFNISDCVHQLNEYGLAKNWGRDYGRVVLREYLLTNNASLITSQGNLRTIVTSMAPTDLLNFYNQYFHDNLQINNQNSISVVASINLNTSGNSKVILIRDYYNDFLKNSGNVENSTFGADQGCIENLCDYYIDGQKMSYREAMYYINNCKRKGLPLPKVRKIGSDEYMRLKQKLIDIGFTPGDASVVMSTVNYAGACSYASVANEIFCTFSNKPELFKQKFGYDMYKIDQHGNKVLNASELLLDMYVHCNMKKNGGNFIEKSVFSKSYSLNKKYLTSDVDVFNRNMLDADNQIYMSRFSKGKNVSAINSFLSSHGLKYTSEVLYVNNANNNVNSTQMSTIVDTINQNVRDGSVVSLDIFSQGSEIRMISTNPSLYSSVSTRTWGEGGGHSVYVTGITKEGFVVSSWGQEYVIPFADLQNGGMFDITSSTMYNK